MAEKKVVLTHVKLSERAETLLKGYAEVYAREEVELGEILPGVNVLMGFVFKPEELRMMKRLEMIQAVSAGVDGLPWEAIPEHVIVCSNRGSNAEAVAEHAWALILALSKNIPIHLEKMRRGVFEWKPESKFLYGKTLGIIGVGSIGGRVAAIGKAMGMRVMGITRSGKTSAPCDFIGGPESLEKVLQESDVVVLSTPLTKQTRGMINLRRLRLMKREAILVNVGRAELIVREDLLKYLEENPEFRLGLDVWWHTRREFYLDKEILKYPNVIGTPWIAGGFGSKEAFELMIKRAAENVARYLRGEEPRNVVDRSDYV